MLFRIIVCFTLCVSLLPSFLNAHEIGASYEEEIEGYLVDIGYNPELVRAGEKMRFDFELYQINDLNTWEPSTLSDVWVQIKKEDTTYFAGGISNPRFGSPGFLYIFSDPGIYSISARYQHEGESLIETTFDLSVASSSSDNSQPKKFPWLLATSSSLLFFAVLIFVTFKLRQRRV